MLGAYQLTFDDLKVQDDISKQSGRTAYIDECGSFGFDFSLEGNSKYYILCAVVVEDNKLPALEQQINEVKKRNGLAGTEMKSSAIGGNIPRRTKIINELLQIEFRVVLLIADKQRFKEDTPLTDYKKSFIKFLHQRLYDQLYHVYPKLKIIEDEIGKPEFQESFKRYVANRRPNYNLFNEYDFDYCDSKNSSLIQLADMVGGSINQYLVNDRAPNYLEILRGKIITIDEFPGKSQPYWGTKKPEDYKYDKDIYMLSLKCANDYIEKHKTDELDEKRAQIAFLRYLIFCVQNMDPSKFIYANQLVSVIDEYIAQKASRNYLYRKVIAPLRDNGVIIASSPHGYKIPISVDDILKYMDSTKNIVSPMLNRMGICRKLILQQTDTKYDVLDNPAYLQFKRYFD